MTEENINVEVEPAVIAEVEQNHGITEDQIKSDIESAVKEEPQVEDTRTPEEKEFDELQRLRMGKFKVQLSIEDATYLKNLLNKVEYKGPQQAYLLLISSVELTAICEELKPMDRGKRHEVELSAACIESLNFFMKNKTGKGTESAQRLFTASMMLRQSISIMNELDDKLKALSEKIQK